MTLLPHQAQFVETALEPCGPRVIALHAAVGLGKTAALVALVARVLEERASARVLLLVPAMLRGQWETLLHRASAPVRIVDRFAYREMYEAAGAEMWPRGTALVLSPEFARQPDIRASIAKEHWDVVVVDESHHLTGARADLLRLLNSVTEKIVLAGMPGEFFAGEIGGDVSVVEWRVEDVVDSSGKRVVLAPPPRVHEVPIDWSGAERDFLAAVGELARSLQTEGARSSFATEVLERAARSSPSAAETMLRKYVAEPESASATAVNVGVESGDCELDGIDGAAGGTASGRTRAAASIALRKLDDLRDDRKATAFVGLVSKLTSPEHARVCVVSEFVSTVYYLAATLEAHSLQCRTITGELSHDQRVEAVHAFLGGGSVLVASRAVLSEGWQLSAVTDLVLYDYPAQRRGLSQLLGRFDRIGRRAPLEVHAFLDSDMAAEAIRDIRQSLPSRDSH